jgi:hypothetical protein
MTHFCSLRLTHAKNTIWRGARRVAGDIIHAEGERFAVPSSTLQACKVLSLRGDISVPLEEINCPGCGQARCARYLPAGKNGLAGRKGPVHLVVVLGHFWRAKYGHFSRAPKRRRAKTSLPGREALR